MGSIIHEGIVKSDHLKYLKTVKDEKYYVFFPSLIRLFPKSGSTRKIDVKQYCRFLLMYLSGYKVYVSTTLDDLVKCTIAFSRGGGYRFPFSTKKDLIDGPSFTVAGFRGQGAAVRLGDIVMNEFEKDYDVVYGTVERNNHASLKRCAKNGFSEIGYITYNYWKRAVIDDNGEMVLVAYHNKNKQNASMPRG